MSNEKEKPLQMQGPVCPLPLSHQDRIVMGHGSGGQMTHDLIINIFQKEIGNNFLAQGNDAAHITLNPTEGSLAISTDSHVVSPLFFPGGDIGRLAVSGTVNDICMLGAIPKYLTAGFILEEGFPIQKLQLVIRSMADSCQMADVKIVAGDTKVVQKGKGDGLYINTAGVGIIPVGRKIGGGCAKPRDAVLISGTLGDHGIAVLQARGELGFDSAIKSDVAPLNHMIHNLLQKIPDVHVLRDPTRGGLATTLNEIAAQSQISILLDEETIPINPQVQVACEMLGFDPLYVANEGKAIIILPESQVDAALSLLKSHPAGQLAARIGTVRKGHPGRVLLKTAFNSTRVLDRLSGALLPRIC